MLKSHSWPSMSLGSTFADSFNRNDNRIHELQLTGSADTEGWLYTSLSHLHPLSLFLLLYAFSIVVPHLYYKPLLDLLKISRLK